MASEMTLRSSAQNTTRVGASSSNQTTAATKTAEETNRTQWTIPDAMIVSAPEALRAIAVPFCDESTGKETVSSGIKPQVQAFNGGNQVYGLVARNASAHSAAIDDPFRCTPAFETRWVREHPLLLQTASAFASPRSQGAFAVLQDCVLVHGWQTIRNNQGYFEPGTFKNKLSLNMTFVPGRTEALCRVPYPTREAWLASSYPAVWLFPNGANPVLDYSQPFFDPQPSAGNASCSTAAAGTVVQNNLGAALSLSADGASGRMRAASALGTTASASFALLAVVGYGLGLLGGRQRAAQPAPIAPSAS
jgi:hypothetical protein